MSSSLPSGSLLTTVVAAILIMAGSATVGGCLAYVKRRPPIQGVLLGLLLGPIGVLIELRIPFAHRPQVDENAWNSLRSMVDFQETGREYDRRRDQTGAHKV